MNYIVLDLEWNQCADGKEFEKSSLPFEIIEIGAVKLDENRHVTDRFSQIVKPQVYKKIHEKTKQIINIDTKELEKGRSFVETMASFFEWCGKDYIFCTWGSMDLTELQRNLKFFKVKHSLPFPLKYYNVQKMFGIQFENSTEAKTLEYAVDALSIEKTQQFHSAVSDAYYTGLIFEKINHYIMDNYFSIDYYRCPDKKENEIYIYTKERIKYISRGFYSKEDVMADKTVTRVNCNICKKALKKKVKWFSSNSKIHYCICKCDEHGYIRGKIRIKKNEDGKYFAIKTIKQIDEKGVKKLIDHKEELRLKRKQKRNEKKNNLSDGRLYSR